MSIPTFDQLMRPVLELATHGTITRRSASAAMADRYRLSLDEREKLLPSGGDTFISNRTGWAMTFLTSRSDGDMS